MKSSIQITHGVPPRGPEAARLYPPGTIRVMVDWPLPVDDNEENIRPDVVAALSQALAACGKVAFRCDECLPGVEISIPPPPQSLITRLLDFLGLGGNAFGIAVAIDPVVVASLFSHGGWSYASQSVLVFDPDVDPSPILAALRQDPDWRKRALPEGVRLLFGPGHDGDFAIVTAADAVWLDRFRYALA